MIRINILCEGQTEERFIKELLVDKFSKKKIHLFPRLIHTSRTGRGGHVNNYAHIQRDVLMLLNDSSAYVTTMLDYYGLPDNFPGMSPVGQGDCFQRAEEIERKFHEDICTSYQKRRKRELLPSRFIPNLILHEFEGLIFSSPLAMQEILRQNILSDIEKILSSYQSPEEINDSRESSPSKRLKKIYPAYNKVFDGVLIAKEIGLPTIRKRCQHFDGWLRKLEALNDHEGETKSICS